MGALTDAVDEQKRRPGISCSISILYAKLDDEARAELMGLLYDKDGDDWAASSNALARGVASVYDIHMTDQIVRRHRGRSCSTCRDAGLLPE